MAFTCSYCGYKSSEVKAGGAVPTLGTSVSLHATSFEDLKRDVLKSDSAMVMIPELELELSCGTLGGQYTTVEGLLQKIESNVRDINPFSYGDSTTLHHSEELKKGNGNIYFGLCCVMLSFLAGSCLLLSFNNSSLFIILIKYCHNHCHVITIAIIMCFLFPQNLPMAFLTSS
jgi:hypothetical protein